MKHFLLLTILLFSATSYAQEVKHEDIQTNQQVDSSRVTGMIYEIVDKIVDFSGVQLSITRDTAESNRTGYGNKEYHTTIDVNPDGTYSFIAPYGYYRIYAVKDGTDLSLSFIRDYFSEPQLEIIQPIDRGFDTDVDELIFSQRYKKAKRTYSRVINKRVRQAKRKNKDHIKEEHRYDGKHNTFYTLVYKDRAIDTVAQIKDSCVYTCQFLELVDRYPDLTDMYMGFTLVEDESFKRYGTKPIEPGLEIPVAPDGRFKAKLPYGIYNIAMYCRHNFMSHYTITLDAPTFDDGAIFLDDFPYNSKLPEKMTQITSIQKALQIKKEFQKELKQKKKIVKKHMRNR